MNVVMQAWLCAGVVGSCECQFTRWRPGRRTRRCSRPLRARDRCFLKVVGGALAAAKRQPVGRTIFIAMPVIMAAEEGDTSSMQCEDYDGEPRICSCEWHSPP